MAINSEKSVEMFVKENELLDSHIEWSNLIFLPFHPVFRMFVLFSVFVKAVLGPIQSVYPVVYCYTVMDQNVFLSFIKYSYWYFCDLLYGIDTFLHIAHRQVTDKAMRREHVPKSVILLMCDLAALIPFFRLIEADPCPRPKLWPNILAFNEFLIIYRVTQYFKLVSTHSYSKLLIGYTIVLAMWIHCLTCFWILLSEHGFCDACTHKNTYYDWRASILYKLNETYEEYTTYVYGFVFIYSFTLNSFYDNESKPSAILEFTIICIFLVIGYLLNNFIVIPKTFAEATFRLRRICVQYPAVQKIVQDTKRRNPSSDAYLKVESYYTLLWRKRSGIINMPPIFKEDIPRYLRLEIMQDLLWPLFYHSPILRKSSFSFRRYLSEGTTITYKLPGEKFYSESHGATNLYYVKSGVVQLISLDDGVTPILSVTEGTIFGDINFLIPNIKRKVDVRCLTYCEIYYVLRKTLLKALHKYPEDRKRILRDARDRIKHGKSLFSNKTGIRGLDRKEDEGIAWIKRRWWEIFETIKKQDKLSGIPKDRIRIDLPREETMYHCAKYIGQLALCTKTQLQTKSMFSNFSFPWILNSHSEAGYIWNKIVYYTVILVLILHPQNLVKPDIPAWFIFFSYWTDTIYAMDIAVSLFTAVNSNVKISFATVLFQRWRTLNFILDILATIWIEDIADMLGASRYYYSCQFNRLIKVHILFRGTYVKWNIKKNPLATIFYKLALINVTHTIILSHIIFEMTCYIPTLTVTYFFGRLLCSKCVTTDCEKIHPYFGVTLAWIFQWTFSETVALRLIDSYFGVAVSYSAFILFIYCKGRFVAYLYLKHENITSYQNFVMNIKKYYQHYRIHKDLLKRLDRYFICHWKYYKGIDVMMGNSLKHEPYEVYWKAQGSVARMMIGESKAFYEADPNLVKQMARAAKFLVMPRLASMFMFGVPIKNIIWIVQGFIKCEYYDAEGDILTKYYGPGNMLAVSAIFSKSSLRTYTAYTDCEIIYIPTQDFFNIYMQNPIEYSFIKDCQKEFGPMFDELFKTKVLKHRSHQIKARDIMQSSKKTPFITETKEYRSLPFEGQFWVKPESKFMQTWLMFRCVIVVLSILSVSILGSLGARYRWMFMKISAFCDCISWIDIIMKLFLGYYNEKGLLITSKKKCLLNYLSKGFALDVLGAVPWFEIIKGPLSADIDNDTLYIINTVTKFGHIYIIFAYFNYITDVPTVNVTLIMIVKWQLVNILIALGVSHYFMAKCVKFQFNNQLELVHIGLRSQCWVPDYMELPQTLTWDEMHLLFAHSLSLAECGMLGMNFGRFVIDREHLGVGFVMFALALVFWFITCYTLTLLVLNAQGDRIFQHSCSQLSRFLHNERVEKPIIEKIMAHFRYCWIRTEGVNIQQLTTDRIGVVFRQDLNYYFYKKTLAVMDSIIKGGELMQRHLANACTQEFYLPGYDIFREMDLVTRICIVHRGRVVITKDGKKVITLSKGDLFGQFTGTRLRPIRVTATTEDNVDLLYIDFHTFHNIISQSEEVKYNILRNPQHKHDFLATKKMFIENPYDTVHYLLRGRKCIHLPCLEEPTEARHDSWYARWLFFAWVIGPFISTALICAYYILPTGSQLWVRIYYALIACDVVHLANFLSEFYSIELVVVSRKCTYQRIGFKILKSVFFYVDALTLFIPLITLISGQWEYQIARFFRLKYFYDFHFHFCKSFKSTAAPFILKLAIFLLLLHGFACGWIYFGCRNIKKFPVPLQDMTQMNITIDFNAWQHPEVRGEGCARTTRNILRPATDDRDASYLPTYVVPKAWENDYIIALTFILLIHTHTSIDSILAMNLSQVYYKVFVTFFMYIIDIYIMAYAINAVYTKYRELYQYDYAVRTMLTYLTDCGLVKTLVEAVLQYTEQLWDRQKGEKLPDIAYEGPPCLREDLFCALYIHHLEAAPTFRALPFYFKRQLAARFQRVVVFPGKCIVHEGDTFNVTYFIHEGEVEKWFIDENGDSKLVSVLYTNGYFGCIAGLFVNMGYQFSYYSRTVVDLVYLSRRKWEDLLEGYPEIKVQLYESTKNLEKFYTKTQ